MTFELAGWVRVYFGGEEPDMNSLCAQAARFWAIKILVLNNIEISGAFVGQSDAGENKAGA